MNTPAVELLHQLNLVYCVALQPREPIYHDDIPLTHSCQKFAMPGTSSAGTGNLLLKNTGAPAPRQVFKVRIRVLVVVETWA